MTYGQANTGVFVLHRIVHATDPVRADLKFRGMPPARAHLAAVRRTTVRAQLREPRRANRKDPRAIRARSTAVVLREADEGRAVIVDVRAPAVRDRPLIIDVHGRCAAAAPAGCRRGVRVVRGGRPRFIDST